MTFYANDVHPIPPDHGADDCDDQLPLISRVGRGIKGDSSRVRITDPDSCVETYLEGGHYDEGDKMWHSEWVSENINGGELKYQYNLRPYTLPRTFTITFIYTRPGRHEWSWTTPAIPYIWSTNGQDGPNHDEPEHIVGTGIATLFLRTMHTSWKENLVYPIDPDTGKPYPRSYFNAPNQGQAWTSNITFGFGGDIEVPDLDDIAKIIGITKDQLVEILEGNNVTINGIEANNLVKYIDKCDDRDLKHLHNDLGFGTTGRVHSNTAFGGEASVKAYIDKLNEDMGEDVDDKVAKLKAHINNLYGIIDNLVSHIYGATLTQDTIGTPSSNVPDGSGCKINWSLGTSFKIPQGNINVLSDDQSNSILTHDAASTKIGDLKGK